MTHADHIAHAAETVADVLDGDAGYRRYLADRKTIRAFKKYLRHGMTDAELVTVIVDAVYPRKVETLA